MENLYSLKTAAHGPVRSFLIMVTQGTLAKRQYDVLEKMIPYPILDKHSRAAISEQLGISCYNLNNIINKLESNGILERLPDGKLKSTIDVPEDLENTTISIKLRNNG